MTKTEYQRARTSKWRDKDPEHYRALKLATLRRYIATHTEEIRSAIRRYRAKNPEKLSAHRAVAYALRVGKIVRQPCPCGDPKSQAHHPDYAKKLEVIWLCAKHHKELHRRFA